MSTSILGLIIVGILIGWDVYLLFDKIPRNTWSEVLRLWGLKTLIVPWAWGGLGGHFFHFLKKSRPAIEQPGNIVLLIWLSVLVALISLGLTRAGIDTTYFMLVAFLLGTVTWMFLWPV